MTKKIFKSTMLVAAMVLAIGLALVLGLLYSYFTGRIETELEREARYLSWGVESQGLDYLDHNWDNDTRITYIQQDGTVLYDSQAEVSEMENHSDREEVQEALKSGNGEATRRSSTLSEQTIYYALKLSNGNVLRISTSHYSIFALLYGLLESIIGVLLVMLALSGIFSAKISKKIVEPINKIDLEHPEENQVYEEIAPLLSRLYKQNRMIEEQLEEAGREQEKFSIITENMQEGLLVIDRYTMILSGNSSAWRLFQAPAPKAGESVYVLSRSEEFRRSVGSALSGNHEETVLKIGGSDIQLIANPVTREGYTEGAVLLLTDVTEQMERENLRREFSANVSHELKTPLTSISGFAEIIQSGFVKDEDIKKFAGRIYREAQRLIKLVEDVIQISQLDEDKNPYEWEDIDLYAMAKETCHNLLETAKKNEVDLYVGGDHGVVPAVYPIMEEIMFNLCENAIKYNKKGGSVSVLLKEGENSVSVTVKDTGIGIPKEDQDRIFERFYRVDKSHSKEIGGTGLGLSIVKHGVSFHHGTITLESELGIGTAITVTFPKVGR